MLAVWNLHFFSLSAELSADDNWKDLLRETHLRELQADEEEASGNGKTNGKTNGRKGTTTIT